MHLAVVFEIIRSVSLEQGIPWGISQGCKGKLERNGEKMRRLMLMAVAIAAAVGVWAGTETVGG